MRYHHNVFPEDGSEPKIRMNKDLYCSGEVACMSRGGEYDNRKTTSRVLYSVYRL